MYREEILDHYKRPRNEGELDKGIEAEGENPSCGDHTHLSIELQGGKIKDIKHKTEGCAISTAGISILSENIKGKKVEEVKELDREWMINLLNIEISPMRVKCAVLGLKTVQKALKNV